MVINLFRWILDMLIECWFIAWLLYGLSKNRVAFFAQNKAGFLTAFCWMGLILALLGAFDELNELMLEPWSNYQRIWRQAEYWHEARAIFMAGFVAAATGFGLAIRRKNGGWAIGATVFLLSVMAGQPFETYFNGLARGQKWPISFHAWLFQKETWWIILLGAAVVFAGTWWRVWAKVRRAGGRVMGR